VILWCFVFTLLILSCVIWIVHWWVTNLVTTLLLHCVWVYPVCWCAYFSPLDKFHVCGPTEMIYVSMCMYVMCGSNWCIQLMLFTVCRNVWSTAQYRLKLLTAVVYNVHYANAESLPYHTILINLHKSLILAPIVFLLETA
jgi:hypothetical protein